MKDYRGKGGQVEFINDLSEVLFGYREASEEEMMERVLQWQEELKKWRVGSAPNRIREKLYELQELIEELEDEEL